MKNKLALLTLLLCLTSCKTTGVILRDPDVYWNEIRFVDMALTQNTELLKAHIDAGHCSCDADGKWNSELCEKSAANVATLEARLDWHLAQMEYLGRFKEKKEPGELPEIPDSSYLCPQGAN